MINELAQTKLRRMVVGTLFLPLFIYSFFSVGTMPAFSKQGVEIIICSGDELKTIIVDNNGEPIEEVAHTPCDWSMQIHTAMMQAPLLQSMHADFCKVCNSVCFETVMLLQKIHHKHQARAPPLTI